jgi:hypothetical protein
MNSGTCDEEILELNADFSDLNSDDEQVIETQNNIDDSIIKQRCNEKVWLKFFRKGKVSIIEYRDELLKMLVTIYGLKIDGIFFVDNSSVLVEVVLDNSAKNYFVFIYEERLGNKMVKSKSINNIVNLCDGKFSLTISNVVMFLVFLPRTSTIHISCASSTYPYGLCNGKIINLESSCFIVDVRFNIYECLLTLQGELINSMNCFVGLRLEASSESNDMFKIRFSLKHECLTSNFLIALKKIFGTMFFSLDTFHLVPSFVNTSTELSAKLLSVDLTYPSAVESSKLERTNTDSRLLRRKSKKIKRHSLLYRQN